MTCASEPTGKVRADPGEIVHKTSMHNGDFFSDINVSLSEPDRIECCYPRCLGHFLDSWLSLRLFSSAVQIPIHCYQFFRNQ